MINPNTKVKQRKKKIPKVKFRPNGEAGHESAIREVTKTDTSRKITDSVFKSGPSTFE